MLIVLLCHCLLLHTIASKTPAYNRPKICSNAVWSTSPVILADGSVVGFQPHGIFVDNNNTIYMPARSLNRVTMWIKGNSSVSRIIDRGLLDTWNVFATDDGNIYIDNGAYNKRIDMWTPNASEGVAVMNVDGPCADIFVDWNDSIYCSLFYNHRVIKTEAYARDRLITIAGTGNLGSASDMFNGPNGIFVDTDLTMYVADSHNHRIQRFAPGQKSGFTVVGEGSSHEIYLRSPADIILDFDGYMYITSNQGNGIVAEGPDGFRWIFRCATSNPTAAPNHLAFDTLGNLYYSDYSMATMNKFILMNKNESTVCRSMTIQLTPSDYAEFFDDEHIIIHSMIMYDSMNVTSIQVRWTIENSFNQTVMAIANNHYLSLPEGQLTVGKYFVKVFVSQSQSSTGMISASASTVIRIVPSSIQVHLFPSSSSIISHGYEQELIMDPGQFSIDPIESPFPAQNWNYRYFYLLHGVPMEYTDFETPNANPYFTWMYSHQSKSSVRIQLISTSINQTLQFQVEMSYRLNASRRSLGSLIVLIRDVEQPKISSGVVQLHLCKAYPEYFYCNINNQLTFFSSCFDSCQLIRSVSWLIDQSIQIHGPNISIPRDFFLNSSMNKIHSFEIGHILINGYSRNQYHIRMNQGPQNGRCSINPPGGTTGTSFHIKCSNWSDPDQIKDYSFYLLKSNRRKMIPLGVSIVPEHRCQLPDDKDLVTIVVHVRDRFHAVTEYRISPIVIRRGSLEIDQIIHHGDETLLGYRFLFATNHINRQNLNEPDLNAYAIVREKLMTYLANQAMTNVDILKMQSTYLQQITEKPDQLTRSTLVLATKKLVEFTDFLDRKRRKISYEDLDFVVDDLIHSTTEIITALNGPLQDRMMLVESDKTSTIEDQHTIIIEAHQRINRAMSLLNEILGEHLIIGQHHSIHSPNAFSYLNKLTSKSLSNYRLELPEQGHINLSSISTPASSTAFVRSMVHPIAFADLSSTKAFTNYSRAVTLDLLNEENKYMTWSGEIELFIPRDPALPIPDMLLQNTTYINDHLNESQFYSFQIDLPRQAKLDVSFHLQLRPTVIHTSYLLVDSFNHWVLFCPDHQEFYTYFIDNEQIGDLSSIILRLRELSSNEVLRYCYPSPSKTIPRFDQTSSRHFSSDYYLRTFLSGCYYFTTDHRWQSDGLRVGPKTNLTHTQCFAKR